MDAVVIVLLDDTPVAQAEEHAEIGPHFGFAARAALGVEAAGELRRRIFRWRGNNRGWFFRRRDSYGGPFHAGI
jgi:hypothetical protein